MPQAIDMYEFMRKQRWRRQVKAARCNFDPCRFSVGCLFDGTVAVSSNLFAARRRRKSDVAYLDDLKETSSASTSNPWKTRVKAVFQCPPAARATVKGQQQRDHAIRCPCMSKQNTAKLPVEADAIALTPRMTLVRSTACFAPHRLPSTIRFLATQGCRPLRELSSAKINSPVRFRVVGDSKQPMGIKIDAEAWISPRV